MHEIMSASGENVRAELQKRISSLVLTPSVDATGPLYTITGDVALFSAPEGAVQATQPPLAGLHCNIPIALELRPYRRRPKGWNEIEQSTTGDTQDALPLISGSTEGCESPDELQCHAGLLRKIGNVSGMSAT
jgi:hypothetical protein